jgi:hypothetical protein
MHAQLGLLLLTEALVRGLVLSSESSTGFADTY